MKKVNKTKELKKVRTKVNNEWSNYRKSKERILSRRLNSKTKQKLIASLRTKTLKSISEDYSIYRIKVYDADNKSNLKLTKEFNIKTGYEEHFKLKRLDSKKLYKDLKRVARKKHLRYILVIIALYWESTDTTQTISETITPIAIERIDENIIYDIINTFMQKYSQKYEHLADYTIRGVYLRLIYENSKTDRKTKEFRKYRQAEK